MNKIRFFLILYSVLYINAGYCHGIQSKSPGNTVSQKEKSVYRWKIIDAKNHSFGYDIYANNKLIIHQTTIPSLPGNEGFKKKMDAEKVAGLVIGKLETGNNFPTVSKDELNKLGIEL